MGFDKNHRPAPLDIAATNVGARQYSIDSAASEKQRSTSYSSEYSIPDTPQSHHRKDSAGSTSHKKANSPTVNVYTHCGRHSEQYLFRGWGDMVRGIVRRD